MKKYLLLLANLIGHLDKAHGKVTKGYDLWMRAYAYLTELRALLHGKAGEDADDLPLPEGPPIVAPDATGPAPAAG